MIVTTWGAAVLLSNTTVAVVRAGVLALFGCWGGRRAVWAIVGTTDQMPALITRMIFRNTSLTTMFLLCQCVHGLVLPNAFRCRLIGKASFRQNSLRTKADRRQRDRSPRPCAVVQRHSERLI